MVDFEYFLLYYACVNDCQEILFRVQIPIANHLFVEKAFKSVHWLKILNKFHKSLTLLD